MRILMVTPTFLPYMGGQETYVQELSESLVERGHEVTVCTTDVNSRIPFRRASVRKEKGRGLTIIRYPCYAFLYSYLPISPRLMLSLFGKNVADQDILHAHGYGHLTSDAVAFAHKILKIPAVLTTHGLHQETGQEGALRSLLWVCYRDSLLRFTVNSVDRIVVLSPDEIRYLARFGDKVKDRTTTVPIGISVEAYANHEPESESKPPTIIYVGRIDRGKGLEFLLEAASKLKMVARVVLVGPKTDYAKYLEELASKRKLENIVFTGIVDEAEKIRLLKSATVFCLPSRYEGASLSTLEAMAAGKPVVATKVGGLPYLVEDGSSGYLVGYSDVEALAARLEKLISDPTLSRAMGKRGEAICKQFSWSRVARRMEDIYHELT